MPSGLIGRCNWCGRLLISIHLEISTILISQTLEDLSYLFSGFLRPLAVTCVPYLHLMVFLAHFHHNCLVFWISFFPLKVLHEAHMLTVYSIPESYLKLKDFLHTQFGMKNLGFLLHFLDIEVATSRHGLLLMQQKYI